MNEEISTELIKRWDSEEAGGYPCGKDVHFANSLLRYTVSAGSRQKLLIPT